MERRKTLPPGTYWCRRLGRFVLPGETQYNRDTFEELTVGPLERGLFGDDFDEISTVRDVPSSLVA